MHYYKFNISDWSLGTSHLSLIEEAIYFRLINHYYDSEQPISLETESVFRRLRIGSESVIAQRIIEEFFVKTDKGFVHARCDTILKEYKKTTKTNRSNGAKGGRPKSVAASETTQEEPTGLFSVTHSEPTHNPNYKLLTTNQEPRTIIKELDARLPATPKKLATRLPSNWKPTQDYWDAAIKIDSELAPRLNMIAEKFKNYWVAKSGKDATKMDWLATWKNWVIREAENAKTGSSNKSNYGTQRAELFDAVTDPSRATNF